MIVVVSAVFATFVLVGFAVTAVFTLRVVLARFSFVPRFGKDSDDD
jgi:hypothetical protein